MSKRNIARALLEELDRRGEDGARVQQRLISELLELRGPVDQDVESEEAAVVALARLRDIVGSQSATTSTAGDPVRRLEAEHRLEEARARRQQLDGLLVRFQSMLCRSDNPQGRGYEFEELLGDIFAFGEIRYTPPFRDTTTQTDGHFEYKGFHYLVEARWRKTAPDEADLHAFQGKVQNRMQGTRGLFVSVPGFRSAVLSSLGKGGNSVILMDGSDLMEVLEDRLTLADALDYKLQEASKYGTLYAPLRDRES